MTMKLTSPSTLIISFLIFFLVLSVSCTPLIVRNTGVDYQNKIHCGKSIQEIHSILGQPSESDYFNELQYVQSIESFPKYYNESCVEKNNYKTLGYDKFIVTGVIRQSETDLAADWFFFFDFITLCTIEFLTFPMAVSDYIEAQNTEKEIIIWYDDNSNFISGEITNKETGKHLVTLW